MLQPPKHDRDADENNIIVEISNRTAEVLGIPDIAEKIRGPGITTHQVESILRMPSGSSHVIQYRNEVFRDIVDNPELMKSFEELIPKIHELFYFNRIKQETDSQVLQTIWRLGELELYVECVHRLNEAFDTNKANIHSQALIRLSEHVDTIARSDTFGRMSEELPKLRKGLRLHKSVTVGINLDDKLRPVEATLLSINNRRFEESSLLGRLFGSLSDRREFQSLLPVHTTPMPENTDDYEESLPLSPLFRDIESLLKSLAFPISEKLKRYLHINGEFLRSLSSELAFYVGAARLEQQLKEAGLSVCLPHIEDESKRKTSLEGFYNLELALSRLSDKDTEQLEIVLNDCRLDTSGRVAILTGPNQGGKTTFTQGIGIAHLLAQCGLFVPAERATLSPADALCTHFPTGEQGQIRTGRLAEEIERLSTIFSSITEHSLVILNESLATTSPLEGLHLAEDVVKSLGYIGSRAVFATHLHELAEAIPTMNEEIQNSETIISLVAGVETDGTNGNRRTFRISRGTPTGKSFAADIARKYRISFDDIREQVDNKKSKRG